MAREDFEQDRYDPNRIYVGGAKDRDGHSTNLRCHVPDPWAAAINELTNSGQWPEYTTVQGFMRDALYHRLRWAAAQKDRAHSTASKNFHLLLAMGHQLDEKILMRESFVELREKIEKVCRDGLNDGDFDGTRATLERFRSQIEESEFPETYRRKLFDDLEWWEKKAANY